MGRFAESVHSTQVEELTAVNCMIYQLVLHKCTSAQSIYSRVRQMFRLDVSQLQPPTISLPDALSTLPFIL